MIMINSQQSEKNRLHLTQSQNRTEDMSNSDLLSFYISNLGEYLAHNLTSVAAAVQAIRVQQYGTANEEQLYL